MGTTSKQEEYLQLVEAVFQANGKLLAIGDQLSAEFGLTGARWQVLGALQLENRPLTVAQIARRQVIKEAFVFFPFGCETRFFRSGNFLQKSPSIGVLE